MKTLVKLPMGAVLLLICFMISAWSQATVSVMSDAQWHSSSVDNAFMNKKIAEAAEQYTEYAPVTRIAFYDIGYPQDNLELQEMNGYAVLLVSALSQDPVELPIKRVYVKIAGKEVELVRFKEIAIRNSDLGSQSVKTFGQYRVDSLYLLPLHLRLQTGELLIDFAKNRVGMKLAEFDGSIPNDLKDIEPVEKKSIDKALTRFMNREYPGYLDN